VQSDTAFRRDSEHDDLGYGHRPLASANLRQSTTRKGDAAVLSLVVMTALAFVTQLGGQGDGRPCLGRRLEGDMGLLLPVTDSVARGLARTRQSAGSGLTRWVRSRCSRSSFGTAG
jgi:hypothetical protein